MNPVIFTCSTIDDRFLFDQKAPWKYVSLNPQGNNLEPDLARLKKIQGKVTIIIGNTDPYYIYSEGFAIYPAFKKNYLWKKYDQRWKTYKNTLSSRLEKKGLSNFEIISWREFEINIRKRLGINFETVFNLLLPQISKFFSPSDFKWELNKLKQNFRPGGYFKSIFSPNNNILNVWVKRKFTEYMVQGLFIYLFLPDSTLIQNEKPTTLRNKMYQPLIKRLFKKELPIICPFGIDDAGYQ